MINPTYDEIDEHIAFWDTREEVLRQQWHRRVSKLIKQARASMETIKKKYRLCTMFEDSLIDYLEKYNNKHRWMSPKGMELLEIWGSSSFWRDKEYVERVPETLITRSKK